VFERELGPLDGGDALNRAMAACEGTSAAWTVLELPGGYLVKVRGVV